MLHVLLRFPRNSARKEEILRNRPFIDQVLRLLKAEIDRPREEVREAGKGQPMRKEPIRGKAVGLVVDEGCAGGGVRMGVY